MPSNAILEAKQKVVAELVEKFKASNAGVIVEYKGITVEADTKLRKELREAGVDYRVVKNTLLKRAAQEANITGFEHVLEGTTAVAFDPEYTNAARIINDYIEKTRSKTYKIKAGFAEGNALNPEQVVELAKLPSREVLVAKALGGLNAPISGFVGVLSGLQRSLVVALNAIAEKQSA